MNRKNRSLDRRREISKALRSYDDQLLKELKAIIEYDVIQQANQKVRKNKLSLKELHIKKEKTLLRKKTNPNIGVKEEQLPEQVVMKKQVIQLQNVIKGIKFYQNTIDSLMNRRNYTQNKIKSLLAVKPTYTIEQMSNSSYLNSLEGLQRRLGKFKRIGREERLRYNLMSWSVNSVNEKAASNQIYI